jgi:SAM-dependent methyltransferase
MAIMLTIPFRKALDFLRTPPSVSLADVQKAKIAQVVNRIGTGATMVNIGSKEVRISGNVINIDINAYKNVDMVSDAHALAIRDQSVAAVFIIATLEIVEQPSQVLREVYRILKPGGMVVATTPFIQTYHPDPVDTHRFTRHGTGLLFRQFAIEEIVPTRGVFNSFLCLLKDFLAVLLSFNSSFLWKANNILFSWLLAPLKYVDRFMPAFKNAEYVSASFTVVATRPDRQP